MNVVNREVVAPRRIRSKLSAVIAALILAGLVVHGIVQRHNNVTDLQTLANEESVPQVQVMSPMVRKRTWRISGSSVGRLFK